MLKNSASLTRFKVILPFLGLLLTACAPEPEVDNLAKINQPLCSSESHLFFTKTDVIATML